MLFALLLGLLLIPLGAFWRGDEKVALSCFIILLGATLIFFVMDVTTPLTISL